MAAGAAPSRRRVAARASRSGLQREEAESLIGALQSGRVDALVVNGADGPEVRTIEGAEAPYRVLANAVQAGAVTLAPSATILYANRYLAALLDVSPAALRGASFAQYLSPHDMPAFERLLVRAAREASQAEVSLRSAGGDPRPVHLALQPVAAGNTQTICAVVTDLRAQHAAQAALRQANETLEARVAERTAALQAAQAEAHRRAEEAERDRAELQALLAERRLAEERVRGALADREVLLRETRHRLRNNLQFLASLFALQASRTAAGEAHHVLEAMADRVHAMARIQDHLYLTLDQGTIDLGTYLGELVLALQDSYAHPGVTFSVDLESVALDVERALGCGLITNELVTNACKYAFPAGRSGRIEVTLHADEAQCLLTVQDTGVGLPPGFSLESRSSLGLEIVSMSARKLRGRVLVEGRAGTRFTVEFPLHDDYAP
jgi:PAS domain S-box-containing protein